MLFSISVSLTNKHVNHTVIFELKKLFKKNGDHSPIFPPGGVAVPTVVRKTFVFPINACNQCNQNGNVITDLKTLRENADEMLCTGLCHQWWAQIS